MLVHSPAAPQRNYSAASGTALASLVGKTVGFIDNSKPNFSLLVDDLSELFVSRCGVAHVMKRGKRQPGMPASDEVMAELLQTCDLVITGSGD